MGMVISIIVNLVYWFGGFNAHKKVSFCLLSCPRDSGNDHVALRHPAGPSPESQNVVLHQDSGGVYCAALEH